MSLTELDKANARIAQLKQFIAENVYPDEKYDEIITESPDTWLSQHDKAVEVKLLQILSKKVDERGNPDRTLGDDIIDMLKARK